MKYTTVNGVEIAEVPVKDFKVILYDGRKKSTEGAQEQDAGDVCQDIPGCYHKG